MQRQQQLYADVSRALLDRALVGSLRLECGSDEGARARSLIGPKTGAVKLHVVRRDQHNGRQRGAVRQAAKVQADIRPAIRVVHDRTGPRNPASENYPLRGKV